MEDIVIRSLCKAFDGKPALQGFSATLPAGRVSCIMAPSGGGKTTAASLIPRFWDVDSGSVTVGGADVRELDSAALMGCGSPPCSRRIACWRTSAPWPTSGW